MEHRAERVEGCSYCQLDLLNNKQGHEPRKPQFGLQQHLLKVQSLMTYLDASDEQNHELTGIVCSSFLETSHCMTYFTQTV